MRCLISEAVVVVVVVVVVVEDVEELESLELPVDEFALAILRRPPPELLKQDCKKRQSAHKIKLNRMAEVIIPFIPHASYRLNKREVYKIKTIL